MENISKDIENEANVEKFNKFSENLALTGISLNKMDAKYNDDMPATENEKQVFIDKKAFYQVIDSNHFKVYQDFALAIADKDDKDNVALQVNSTFVLSFESEMKIDDEIFEILAQTTVLITAWPYFRELVQSATTRMGVPPVVIPPLQASV